MIAKIVNIITVNVLPVIIYFYLKQSERYRDVNRDIYYFIFLLVTILVTYIVFDKKFLTFLPISCVVLWIVVFEGYHIKINKIEKEMLTSVNVLTNKLVELEKKYQELKLEDNKISEELNKYTNLFSLVQEVNENINIDKIGIEFYSKIVKYFGYDKIVYVGLIKVQRKEIVEIKSFSAIDDELLNCVKSAFVENRDISTINNLACFKIYNDQFEYILLVKHYLDLDSLNDLRFFVEETKMGFIRSILFQEVEELSRVDGLTGLYLRRYFISRLNNELLRAQRYNTVFSLIMIDIDFFKKVNDTYGHIVGDFILKSVAETFVTTLKDQALCSRWGGEEFLIFVPYQNKEQTKNLAENIRVNVENSVYEYKDLKLKITVSCGVSSFPQDATTVDELIEIADKRLYEAKRTGRNKVVV